MGWITKFRGIALLFGSTVLLANSNALAVPSFARQTGLPCQACHTTFPELTPFGRTFKLNGYTLTGSSSCRCRPERAPVASRSTKFRPCRPCCRWA